MAQTSMTQRLGLTRMTRAAAGVVLLAACSVVAQEAKQALFERVFGDAVKLDPATVAKVKAIKPGERLFIDRDGDGKNDEVWFIDTAVRHSEKNRPILVRAIDEDGDLDVHKGPDLDSDLYVVDWQADGIVDVVLDYQDNDGDNDVDEMAFYSWLPKHRYFGSNALGAWWGIDDGDDNLLWYDVDYTYYQHLCQYRCHFSGDETFVAFGLTADGERWISGWENPFLFYDPDGDRCSEVVLRIEGLDDKIRAIRYSFDVDDDAFGQRTYNYDFSITAVADKDAPVQLPPAISAGMTLRGIPTQAWLQRQHAQKFVSQAKWPVAVLTWDEMNANTEGDLQRDPHERWEGIIAHSSKNFAQVGGPPCSPLNKRNEVALNLTPPMRLYYDPTDRRLHLKGANEGWLHVDYDYDGKIDMTYTYVDDDGDGIFDRRQLDLDADGQIEFDWAMTSENVREFKLEFETLAAFYKPLLAETLADSQVFIDAAKAALKEKVCCPDAVEKFFLTKLESWMPTTRLGARMRKTPAGARYYMDLLRDRLFGVLQEEFGENAEWSEIENHYATGDYAAAAKLVADKLPSSTTPSNRSFQSFSHRIAIRIDNTSGPQRENWPVALATKDILAAAGNFNPNNFAVVAPRRWIDWRQIPYQIDGIDPDFGAEISFLIDVPADAVVTYYIYYCPKRTEVMSFAPKTSTARDWVPPNIGWESNRVAYREYYGQFDFFGKKTDQLIYPNIGATSYHSETDWGIDALHVGKASGLGGLTLYMKGQAYLVQNPANKGNVKFTKRMIASGPVRAAVEINASNIVADHPNLGVRLYCIVYAEHQETEIRAAVHGADGEVVLAPGLVKLPREQTFADAGKGCFGSWGWQEVVIDEIGLGLIVAPDAVVDVLDQRDERRIRCRTSNGGRLRYWLIGDWRRGRQHPIAPTIDNWRTELNQLADTLIHDVEVGIGQPEPVQEKVQ